MTDERWPETERRKTEQNHEMLIEHKGEIKHLGEKIESLESTVKEMVKNLIDDRKECWAVCNSQLKDIEDTAVKAKTSIDEAKASIKTLKAVGGVVAVALGIWAKFGGGR